MLTTKLQWKICTWSQDIRDDRLLQISASYQRAKSKSGPASTIVPRRSMSTDWRIRRHVVSWVLQFVVIVRSTVNTDQTLISGAATLWQSLEILQCKKLLCKSQDGECVSHTAENNPLEDSWRTKMDAVWDSVFPGQSDEVAKYDLFACHTHVRSARSDLRPADHKRSSGLWRQQVWLTLRTDLFKRWRSNCVSLVWGCSQKFWFRSRGGATVTFNNESFS